MKEAMTMDWRQCMKRRMLVKGTKSTRWHIESVSGMGQYQTICGKYIQFASVTELSGRAFEGEDTEICTICRQGLAKELREELREREKEGE